MSGEDSTTPSTCRGFADGDGDSVQMCPGIRSLPPAADTKDGPIVSCSSLIIQEFEAGF